MKKKALTGILVASMLGMMLTGCGDNKEDLESLRETLLKHAKVKNVYDVNIGCVICSHSGPGVIGISCM